MTAFFKQLLFLHGLTVCWLACRDWIWILRSTLYEGQVTLSSINGSVYKYWLQAISRYSSYYELRTYCSLTNYTPIKSNKPRSNPNIAQHITLLRHRLFPQKVPPHACLQGWDHKCTLFRTYDLGANMIPKSLARRDVSRYISLSAQIRFYNQMLHFHCVFRGIGRCEPPIFPNKGG